jgi:F-type H+-transporting ATPase subunit gamma
MANLKEVRTRISSVISTQQITKAMKLVAASKLRTAQNNIIQIRPYTKKLEEVIGNVKAAFEGDTDGSLSLAQEREPNKVLVVALTSDKGLCGGFNSYLIKTAVNLINEKYSEQASNGNVTILPLGRKSTEYFSKRDYQVDARFSRIFSKLSFDNSAEIAKELIDRFTDGTYDRVEVVYSRFKNAVMQIHTAVQFLPISTSVDDIQEADKPEFKADYIFEPSKEEIIEHLIPTYLKIEFYKYLLDNNASEHGARMTAMDSATENAREILKDLRLEYNRARQAAITKEISEIVGGAAALDG